MSGSVVEAKLSLAIDEFNKNSRAAADEIRKLAREMNGSMTPAANEASGGIGKLSEILREHKSEHVATARAVNAFTKELDGLLGKGSEVGKVLGGLAGGFAIGGILGLGIEAVKLLGEKFTEVSEEEKKSKDELQAWFDTLEKEHGKAVDTIQDLKDKLDGISPIQKLAREQSGVVAQIHVLESQVDGLKSKIGALRDQGQVDIIAKRTIDKSKEEIKSLEEQIDALKRKRDDLSQQGSLTVASEDKSYDDKSAANARKRADEQAELDLRNYAKQLQLEEQADQEAERRADANLAADTARMQKELDEWEKDFGPDGTVAKDAEKAWKKRQEYEQKASEYSAKVNEKNAEDAKEQFAKIEQSAYHYLTPIRRAVDQAFVGLIDGSMDLAKVWDTLWKGMLSTLVDTLVEMGMKWAATKIAEIIAGKAAAISETQGNIAVAVAGAAASQAAIPIFGPGLALGAAADMLGSLEAMTAPLLAASGGFDIPAGLNPVTQLHQQEMVLPANLANPLRAALSGGGIGGDTYNLHFNLLDTKSAEEWVSGRGADGFIRGMRRLQRNGRL